jgi:branched-chain amino acid transport system ATP-binding protein
MTLLFVDNVNAGYGVTRVLNGVTINVSAGEVVGILGPNGAGKSTLLRSISGLVRPTAGEIIFDGQSLVDLEPHAIPHLGLAQVPEARHVFSDLTVTENLLVGGTPLYSRAERKAALGWVFDCFPLLKERAKANAGQLSGGQQQVLAIGRAMMSRPKLIMLDEPSLGLAPRVVEELYDTLHQLIGSGLTLLLVEQDIYAALDFVDRVYVLENGQIALSGKSDELLENDHIRTSYLGL